MTITVQYSYHEKKAIHADNNTDRKYGLIMDNRSTDSYNIQSFFFNLLGGGCVEGGRGGVGVGGGC